MVACFTKVINFLVLINFIIHELWNRTRETSEGVGREQEAGAGRTGKVYLSRSESVLVPLMVSMEVKALVATSVSLIALTSASRNCPASIASSRPLPCFSSLISVSQGAVPGKKCTYGSGSYNFRSWGTILYPISNASIYRRAKAEHAFVDVHVDDEEADSLSVSGGNKPEDYGEVDVILASRVTEERKTEYLILWKDDHPDSWEPAENIARDLVGGYETPWWQAAKKADAEKLKSLLDSEDVQRDVNAIDENERTALHFSAGLGSEKCSRLLVEYGADVHWQDKDGYTALHIASGYVHTNTVKALVELGADPDLEDGRGRSALLLAQELLAKTPRTNPLQFARRMALDQIVKALDEVMYENVEVEQILDKRIAESGATEYLVKWSDGSDDGWVSARDVGEDLVKDYEEGLEYGVVERVLDKREIDGKEEYYVMWSDGKETWETVENIGEEIVVDFNGSRKPSAPGQRLTEVSSTNGRPAEVGESKM